MAHRINASVEDSLIGNDERFNIGSIEETETLDREDQMDLECLECGCKFQASSTNPFPACPDCDSEDLELD